MVQTLCIPLLYMLCLNSCTGFLSLRASITWSSFYSLQRRSYVAPESDYNVKTVIKNTSSRSLRYADRLVPMGLQWPWPNTGRLLMWVSLLGMAYLPRYDLN